MSESRSRRSRYPPEAQTSSRLTAAYAAGSLLAFLLVAIGIVRAWPRWRGTESGPASTKTGWSAPLFGGRPRGEGPQGTSYRPVSVAHPADTGEPARREPAAFRPWTAAGARTRPGTAPPNGRVAGRVSDPESGSSEEEAGLTPQESEAVAAEVERRATRRREEAEAEADEIEAAAQRARLRAEAEADALETRAAAAYEAGEAAFARGQLTETALDQLRQAAAQARERAEAIREAAEAVEEREQERAHQLREEARLAEEQFWQQADALREEAQVSR